MSHTFFCNNLMPIWRPNFRIHFKNDKLAVYGRAPFSTSSENRQKIVGVRQTGNAERAFEFIEKNLKLVPSEDMLISARQRENSLREYATYMTMLPHQINMRNKAMSRESLHGLQVIAKRKNNIKHSLVSLTEIVESPISREALKHCEEIGENIEKSTINASRKAIDKYAEFCLESQNVAFLYAVNKRTFHSLVYTLRGFRFNGTTPKEVGIHQFIASVDSGFVAADFFSQMVSEETLIF